MNRHPRKSKESTAPPRRWLRRLGFVFGLLLLLVGMFLLWLLHTQSGMAFVLARAQSALDNQLGIGAASGSLAGPANLENVRFHDSVNGVDVQVARATIDLGVLALLRGRVVIRDLETRDITVALSTVANSPDKPAKPFSLAAPIDIAVDRLLIERATISKDGQSLQSIDRIDLSGAWAGPGIEIRQLEVKAPNGSVELTGALVEQAKLAGQAQARFDWRAGDLDLAGTLNLRSKSQALHLGLDLNKPTAASLSATISQDKRHAWQLHADVPAFPATHIIPDSTLGNLALQVNGSGDLAHGNLTGRLDLGSHAIMLQPLQYTLTNGVLDIEQLILSSPDHPGDLRISGKLDTGVSPLRSDLVATWQGVELPEDLVGRVLQSNGSLNLSGNIEHFAANGQLALGRKDAMADIEIDIEGQPDALTLNTVRLKQAKGGLDAHGTITLKPELAWQVDANALKFNPGALLADWPGTMDFKLLSSGRSSSRGIEGNLQLESLGGQLRNRALGGSANLRLQPGVIVDGKVDLRIGNSHLKIDGKGGNQTDARVEFDLAALGDWLDTASGSAHGTLALKGPWPNLAVHGDLSARKLAWSDLQTDSIDAAIHVTDAARPAGTLDINALGLSLGSFTFDTLQLRGEGNQAKHSLTLDAKGKPLNLALALHGNADRGGWNGELTTLELDPRARNLPDLGLQKASSLRWSGQEFEIDETCLLGKPSNARADADTNDANAKSLADDENPATPATLCIGGKAAGNGDMDFSYHMEHLPLRLIARLAAPESPLRLRGKLAGEGTLVRKGAGPLRGNAVLQSDKGQLLNVDSGNTPMLNYTGLLLEATTNGQVSHVKMHAGLDHDGLIDGNLQMAPGSDGVQTLDGSLNLALNDLAFVDALSTAVTRTQGRAQARYTIAGSLEAPRLLGAMKVDGLATEVPALGLKLHDGQFNLRAEDASRFVLEGNIAANSGELKISGEGGLDASTPMRITVRGDDVLIADIPAANVSVSPDLVIERSATGIHASGALVIPSAKIDLARLPGGGSSSASADVVVIDAEKPRVEKPSPFSAEIKVTLGEDVKLAGYGFNGNLSGNLTVIEKPGRSTSGSGTLNADGTYKAYGQDLKIQTGRIQFVGADISNPGLDIRAVREIKRDEIVAGLLIRGTAQMPVLTVFSEPPMEQSEALSYLVTGKPLSALKSGEGDMLGTAARALGTAGGDLLAKSIGGRLGVDDIGVADDATLGGAAFTIGKYLSPKLYLSYGVGIFDPGEVVTLRYLFSKHWNFEAQSATTGNRAGINYRLEK